MQKLTKDPALPWREYASDLYILNVAEDERVTGPAYDRLLVEQLCLFARGNHEDQ